MPLHQHEIDKLVDLPADKIPFVEMPCGCIGLRLHGQFYVSVMRCDTDYDEHNPSIEIREHNDLHEYNKDFNFPPVSKDRFIEILGLLQDTIRQGHSYCKMRQMFLWMTKDNPYDSHKNS